MNFFIQNFVWKNKKFSSFKNFWKLLSSSQSTMGILKLRCYLCLLNLFSETTALKLFCWNHCLETTVLKRPLGQLVPSSWWLLTFSLVLTYKSNCVSSKIPNEYVIRHIFPTGKTKSKSATQTNQIANHSDHLGRRDRGTPSQSISQEIYCIQCGGVYKMLLESENGVLFIFICTHLYWIDDTVSAPKGLIS